MTKPLVPYVPEDAPFTDGQRSWLNGYLAGLYSYAPANVLIDQPLALNIAVLYGSQSGTAEGLARKISKELKSAGHIVSMNSLEGYIPATLAAESYALFIVATYGDGEAPESVQPFYQQLCVEHFPLLGNLSYAIFALGDSHYEQFCQFGKDLDAKIASLGGICILNRVESDIDVDPSFTEWKEEINNRFKELTLPHGGTSINTVTPIVEDTQKASPISPVQTIDPLHTRDNPYLSPLVEKVILTHPSSSKLTIHFNFSILDSAIHYEAGDACGVIPQNSANLVDMVLEATSFNGSEIIEVPKIGAMALREGLIQHFAISRLTRKMVVEYAALSRCKILSGLLTADQQTNLEEYLHGRDLVDLLKQCPNVLQKPDELVKMLPRLTPRLYSISSSPAAHFGQIHTTVAVVRYQSHGRERGGVCSTLLAERAVPGNSLPVYIQPNKRFRLPKDTTTPIIMIGPGTGIAPFRSFLHERRALGCNAPNWLFFGDRSVTADFLYKEELESMRKNNHLTRLDLAFSRDQERRIYVQDRMLEQSSEFWRWLQDGASIYVCGDASRMAKDVDTTLHKIIKQEGALSNEAAEEYVQQIKDQQRYHRDVY